MSMDCPRCGAPLERSFYQGRISFRCTRGHGRAMTLSAVRALCGNTGFANMLWRRAAEMPSGPGGNCPVCHHPMTLVTLPVQGGNLELDVCCRCQELWFDPTRLRHCPSHHLRRRHLKCRKEPGKYWQCTPLKAWGRTIARLLLPQAWLMWLDCWGFLLKTTPLKLWSAHGAHGLSRHSALLYS